jgi:MOSC domain-containing protein YiiM
MKAQIASLLLGKIRPFGDDGERSAIAKTAISGAVRVGPMGLEGDEQADRIHHGGTDKAIHHYPRDHYPSWRDELADHPLLQAPGAFGENISTSGLDEMAVCLGDRFRLGTALVEISQGRQPCWKLNRRFGSNAVLARMVQTGFSGWYYRVLEPGQVAAGDHVVLVERPHADWPVRRVFALLIGGGAASDRAALHDLAAIEVLSESWKARTHALLAQSSASRGDKVVVREPAEILD